MAKRGRKKKFDVENNIDIIQIERPEGMDDKISSIRLAESKIVKEQISEEKVSSDTEVVAPPSFRNPLERNYGYGFSDVEFIYPHLRGYWAVDRDISKFLSFGYQYCKKEWIKNYDVIFASLLPSQGQNPSGMVTRDGHVLLVASEEIAKAKHDYAHNKVINPTETFKEMLSSSEMTKRGL